MEVFDLYDRQGNKLNKTMIRGERNQKGEYHRVIHVWIQNRRGEYLIQQRNKADDRSPYQWAPTAGAVISGEASLDTAMRETYEEIGLKLSAASFNFIKTIYQESSHSNYMIDIYKVYQEVDLTTLVLDETEVRDVAFASKEEIFKLMHEGRFWNFKALLPDISYFDILEEASS